MVDPVKFTNFNHNTIELEEKIIFSVLVAGKNAMTTSRCCDNFLKKAHQASCVKWMNPFECLRKFNSDEISVMLRENGIGCQTYKSKSLYELVNSNLNLKTCTVEDLEKIFFIGPKTARMFILHTRPNVDVAVLDVHILRFLADKGVESVPKSTPTGKKYIKLEEKFLTFAKESGMNSADFDLYLWKKYSGKQVA